MVQNVVSKLRQSRKSPVVLKTRIYSLRSRETHKPIFVFEGFDDVGPYCAWIERCENRLDFEALPANGKDQILSFLSEAHNSEYAKGSKIYFFVDRDFDDLRGQPHGSNIFMTDQYSVENYLVSEKVFRNILIDELKCAGEVIDHAVMLFNQVVASFSNCMTPINRRIFYSRRLLLGIRNNGLSEQVAKYVTIKLNDVAGRNDSDSLKILVPLIREPSDEERATVDAEFDKLDPQLRHRGKFILAFFLRWLELLAEERSVNRLALFTSSENCHFSTQQLSMRSLATRSEIPRDLCTFVRDACQRA